MNELTHHQVTITLDVVLEASLSPEAIVAALTGAALPALPGSWIVAAHITPDPAPRTADAVPDADWDLDPDWDLEDPAVDPDL